MQMERFMQGLLRGKRNWDYARNSNSQIEDNVGLVSPFAGAVPSQLFIIKIWIHIIYSNK